MIQADPAWKHVFEVLDDDGGLAADQSLPLRQVTNNRFQVTAPLRYTGRTGLPDGPVDKKVRTLPLDLDRRSDLASVPAALRWFEAPHGAHTLFHDYHLEARVLPAREADLVFRYMLGDLGVPTVKKYLLWAAVALRTRLDEHRASFLLWLALSVVGLGSFVLAALGVDFPSWTGGRAIVLLVTGVAPLPASLLWGREWKAALIAAVMAIWILPAAVLAFVALAVYAMLERLAG